MKYYTKSPQETKDLGSRLAKNLAQGGVVALSGSLGAGKTTFIQGFAHGLGIDQNLTSPTFIVIKSYPLPYSKLGHLFHVDLYRLTWIEQTKELGLEEILSNPKNIVLIEWAQNLGVKLSKRVTQVDIKIITGNQREIEIKS